MKKSILVLLVILLFSTSAYNQGILKANIIFSSQQEIDNFPNKYPYVTGIEGSVIIQESDFGNIINLDGLS